jgi:two-component system cell cycle sensor histidine kinase/response regulator CckA
MVDEASLVLPTGRERILLIDDEQCIVEMGTALLGQLGYKVTPETNSQRGLEIFRSRSGEFDLIITDYTMPKLSGTDLVKELRRIRPNIPIILCTGLYDEVAKEAAMDLGLEFISKPFRIKQLAELVRKALDEQQG